MVFLFLWKIIKIYFQIILLKTSACRGQPLKHSGYVCAYHPACPGFKSQTQYLCFGDFCSINFTIFFIGLIQERRWTTRRRDLPIFNKPTASLVAMKLNVLQYWIALWAPSYKHLNIDRTWRAIQMWAQMISGIRVITQTILDGGFHNFFEASRKLKNAENVT